MKPATMKTKLLKLSQIVTDAGTQIRAKLDEETVAEYAAAMLDSTNKFPPVIVFHDGTRFILADGFHRVMAASRNGFMDIEAEIRKGARSDALQCALGANASHGLKRSNADKRNAVELALAEWPEISDNQLAKICAVSHPFVGVVRSALVAATPSQVVTVTTSKRKGADGKSYPATRKTSTEPEQPKAAAAEVCPEPPKPKTMDAEGKEAFKGLKNAEEIMAGQLREYTNGMAMAIKEAHPETAWSLWIKATHLALSLLSNRQRDQQNMKAYAR